MSKKTTKRIKFGWKITQQNPDKLQNAKWLFPGSALPKTKHQIYFIISTVVKRNQPQQRVNKYSWKSHEMMVFDEYE